MAGQESLRHQMIEVIRRSVSGILEVDLEPEDFNVAIDKAIEEFRQNSENSVEESFMFMDLSEESNTYFLPDEVIEVRQIFRRSVGTPGLGGTEVDPFELAYTNVYILQSGEQSGLTTYNFFTIYQEELGKMFGFFLNFVWEPYTHKLQIMRRPLGNETVLLWVYNEKPEDVLLGDRYSKPWLRDWAIAECKHMLGQAYRKFSNIPGPSGGLTLPGEQLIAEAREEKELLREQLRNFRAGDAPPWFVIG